VTKTRRKNRKTRTLPPIALELGRLLLEGAMEDAERSARDGDREREKREAGSHDKQG
jgi:hypothetical protein